MKHMQLRLYWLHYVIEDGQIFPEYVQTDLMVADILTKALSVAKVAALRRLMGLQ